MRTSEDEGSSAARPRSRSSRRRPQDLRDLNGTLAAASNDGTVHLWDTSPAAAKADVCAGAGQGLTRQEWASYIPGVPYRTPC